MLLLLTRESKLTLERVLVDFSNGLNVVKLHSLYSMPFWDRLVFLFNPKLIRRLYEAEFSKQSKGKELAS